MLLVALVIDSFPDIHRPIAATRTILMEEEQKLSSFDDNLLTLGDNPVSN